MRRPAALACALLGTALAALPCAAGDNRGERQALVFAPTRTLLLLIPAEQTTQMLAQYPLPGTDAASEMEADLARSCSGGEGQMTTRGFFPAAAEKVWRVLLYPIALAVRDELQKYATVSEARASGNYYRGIPAHGATALTNRISCVRFVRFAALTEGDEQVALDFVASVRLDPAHDAIRLAPLRLFIAQAGAKSVNGRYSVAISMGADAVWRDEYSGHEGQLFEHTIATESVDLKSGSYLKYFPAQELGVRVPVIPTSFGVDRSHDFGLAEFSVSVAELGTAPTTLKVLSEMLPDTDQKATQLMIAAALTGVEGH